MWVFDLGISGGISRYAISYSPKKDIAEKYLIDLFNKYRYSINIYKIEKISDIHIPDAINQIFSFKGRKCDFITGLSFYNSEYLCLNLMAGFDDTMKSFQRYKEIIDKYPECFKVTTKQHNFFGKYTEYNVVVNTFPIEETEDFEEYQTNCFKIQYLDGVNDRWMI